MSFHERFKFALRPRGGYVVSFIPFCKIDAGKYDAGIDVKNSLKLSTIYI